MGVVVEATHVALEQRVAIKLLDTELAAEPESLARFLREARIAAKLPSDHVARVTDVGQTEAGAPYIVMELLVGHDLEEERLRRGRLPVADAVDLVLQACQGVADAHAQSQTGLTSSVDLMRRSRRSQRIGVPHRRRLRERRLRRRALRRGRARRRLLRRQRLRELAVRPRRLLAGHLLPVSAAARAPQRVRAVTSRPPKEPSCPR